MQSSIHMWSIHMQQMDNEGKSTRSEVMCFISSEWLENTVENVVYCSQLPFISHWKTLKLHQGEI